MLHPDSKRKRGNHPDISVFLQELWDVMREPGDDLFWESHARDRVSWKQAVTRVAAHLGILPASGFLFCVRLTSFTGSYLL